jgi:hypothetical protein
LFFVPCNERSNLITFFVIKWQFSVRMAILLALSAVVNLWTNVPCV